MHADLVKLLDLQAKDAAVADIDRRLRELEGEFARLDQNIQRARDALDTARRTAVCIDLHGMSDVWNATLSLRGDRLDVTRRGRTLTSIDLRSHRVAATTAPAAPKGDDDAGTSWLPLAAPTAALLLLALTVRRRHARIA